MRDPTRRRFFKNQVFGHNGSALGDDGSGTTIDKIGDGLAGHDDGSGSGAIDHIERLGDDGSGGSSADFALRAGS